MSDNPERQLVTWALATFHGTLFVVVSVLFAYARGGFGGLLANLNTLVGLGLFVALWVTTFFTTGRALEGVDLLGDLEERAFMRRAFRWGAVNGMAFIVVLGAVLIVGSIAATPPGRGSFGVLPIAVLTAPLALVVAATVGAAVGAVFGVIDLGLVVLARRASEEWISSSER